jgi:hypothetical protein
MRRLLHRFHERLSGALTRKLSKVVRADDHDLFASVNGHVLWPFLLRASDHFAESGFGVLQLPPPWSPAALLVPSSRRRRRFSNTGHTDQIIIEHRANLVVMVVEELQDALIMNTSALIVAINLDCAEPTTSSCLKVTDRCASELCTLTL